MAHKEQYMLGRDRQEPDRLKFQHDFFRTLCHGQLLHPSIASDRVFNVADVGTGTGAWILDTAEYLKGLPHHRGRDHEFVGFDISPAQFPASEKRSDAEFVVHNMTTPFPQAYHGKFDVVHVRFLAYALKQENLDATVKFLVELLRPGGYLQWQEVDLIDVWSTPSTLNTRQAVSSISREKMERGLIMSMPQNLIKVVTSLALAPSLECEPLPPTEASQKFNPVSWTNDVLRILFLDFVSTHDHESSEIRMHKDRVGLAVNTSLLRAGASRERTLAAEGQTSSDERELLLSEAEENEKLALAIENELKEGTVSHWDAKMMWLVAQKAIVVGKDSDWMTANHPAI